MTPEVASQIAELINRRNEPSVVYDAQRVMASAANYEYEERDGRVVACVGMRGATGALDGRPVRRSVGAELEA